MKKILFLMLFCGLFTVGCNKADDNTGDNVFVEEVGMTETEPAVQEQQQTEDQNSVNVEASAKLAEQGKVELDTNKNYQKAIEYFTNSLEAAEQAWVYADRGRAKINAGDPNGAIEDFSKAIEMEKRSVYYEWRAQVYDIMENPQAAQTDRNEAAKLPQEN